MMNSRFLSSDPETALHLADLTGGDLVLSVAGIAGYLQSLLAEDPYLVRLWVVGEISSSSPHRNGHLFLTLMDPESGDGLKGVVWAHQVAKLTFLPQVGQQVIALGQIRTYSKTSTYQIQIWQILPAGEGLLALQYQQLRTRLSAEGLFDPELKRLLPSHPSCIAVVSSPQAAAWGDVQRTLRSRYPGLQVLFSPAIVQGDQAPDSIATAIQRVERDGRAELVILARGGGAAEDLVCFNDERVVRAVAECRIPVITGIGHQRDESLADLAADHQAHTPTAAAERAVPRLIDLEEEQQDLAQRLMQVVVNYLRDQEESIVDLTQQLEGLQIQYQLREHHQDLEVLQERLIRSVQQRFQQTELRQRSLQEQLEALDPREVLRRGYALVRQQSGAWVRSPHIPIGTELTIEFASGQLRARVTDSELTPEKITSTVPEPSPPSPAGPHPVVPPRPDA